MDSHSVLQPPLLGREKLHDIFLIVFPLELLVRAAFLLKSAFHCVTLLLGLSFHQNLSQMSGPVKGLGTSHTGIRSSLRHGEESWCYLQSPCSSCVFITPLGACSSHLSCDFRYLKKTSYLKGHRELCCDLSKHTGSRLYVGPLAMRAPG